MRKERVHEHMDPLEYSCDELEVERERWLHVLCWGSEAARARRLPNGERWMTEKCWSEQYEKICRELY